MPKKVAEVVDSINELVAQLGLQKLGADSEDPGTTHPAEKTDENANTQSAVEGARSTENSTDVQTEVHGQSVDEANPADASKETGESATPNITTATMSGEDPKVEDAYKSNTDDPGTSHPASADKKTEKYSAEQVEKFASDILAEAAKIDENTVTDAEQAKTKLAVVLKEAGEEKDADAAIGEFVEGFAKSAALIGDLSADYLDGMAVAMAQGTEKKAQEPTEEELAAMLAGELGGEAAPGAAAAEEAMATVPPEAMMAGAVPAEEMAGEVDLEAEALAEAATELAAELGVSPEEVLEAAITEVEGGAGGEAAVEPPVAVEPPAAEEPAAAPEEEPAAAEPSNDEGKMASEKAAKLLKELKEKAAKYDELQAKQAADAAEKAEEDRLEKVFTNVLRGQMKLAQQKAGDKENATAAQQ